VACQLQTVLDAGVLRRHVPAGDTCRHALARAWLRGELDATVAVPVTLACAAVGLELPCSRAWSPTRSRTMPRRAGASCTARGRESRRWWCHRDGGSARWGQVPSVAGAVETARAVLRYPTARHPRRAGSPLAEIAGDTAQSGIAARDRLARARARGRSR